MTIEQTAALMDILKIAYPQFYRGYSVREIQQAAGLWSSMFSSDDPRIVTEAVKEFISSDIKGFPPSIGQIKAKVDEVKSSLHLGLLAFKGNEIVDNEMMLGRRDMNRLIGDGNA